MKMVYSLKTILFKSMVSILINLLFFFNISSSEQRPPFRTQNISNAIPISKNFQTSESSPRPPEYNSLKSLNCKNFSPDQGYNSCSSTDLPNSPRFVFPPRCIPSAPDLSTSEHTNHEEQSEEESSDSPGIIRSQSSQYLINLDKELANKTTPYTLPSPKDLTKKSRTTRFLATLSRTTNGILVSQKTVAASLKKDQAAEFAKITKKSLESLIDEEIEEEETQAILEKQTQALRKAHEKTRLKQQKVAELILSSSAPSDRQIATSSPTCPSSRIQQRDRSKSLSIVANYRFTEDTHF